MSELIQLQNNIAVRKQFLATVSALALTAYIASTDTARSEDTNRPTVWLELGGQMETMQGAGTDMTAPFMFKLPTPGPYDPDPFIEPQEMAQNAFGLEGKIVVTPEGSDWNFTAAVRYGRANKVRHVHHQTHSPPISIYGNNYFIFDEPYADNRASSSESHLILDFSAGRDVGLGVFGHNGSSTINAGVRFAQFSSHSALDARGRPTLTLTNPGAGVFFKYHFSWDQYHLYGDATRQFRGVGPSVSWNASAALLGNSDDGELSLDWGVNAAVLFGRQKVKVEHSTTAKSHPGYAGTHVSTFPVLYSRHAPPRTQSRNVTVPNVGGFIGLSAQKYNAKISLGYRADFFFGAVDGGIDVHDSKTLGFHGPFATISVGLGG